MDDSESESETSEVELGAGKTKELVVNDLKLEVPEIWDASEENDESGSGDGTGIGVNDTAVISVGTGGSEKSGIGVNETDVGSVPGENEDAGSGKTDRPGPGTSDGSGNAKLKLGTNSPENIGRGCATVVVGQPGSLKLCGVQMS
jgi:hypothetical protein